ncbi:MAG: carboxymuconolactone decarboxylase family protein [Nitriliruptoraceae bacterium]
MPRVPVHTVDDAPAESRETLEALGKQVGKVINIFGEMAHAPALVKMYANTEQLLREESSLDEKTRQAIHLAVAHTNNCEYCQAAYTGAAKAAGHSEDDTIAIRRGSLPDDEKLESLLDVTREIAANTGYVDDVTWKTATEVGWSEQELLEAYAEVVRTIMTNYFNHLVGTELDLPAAPALD